MAIRNIVQDGDPILLKKARPVTDFNDRLHTLLDDMGETMLDANGLGLAGPQVGVLRRVAVVLDTDENIIELVNPEIIADDGEIEDLEGCLSFPGKWGIVTRPERVTVRAQNRDGAWFELEGSGTTARAFCHEIEHLDGIVFTTHVTKFLTQEDIEKMMEDEE